MKKYEKIINTLCSIDKASFDAFEKKLECTPRSEEWVAYEAIENELDELIKQEFAAFKKCILWYRQRAKTADDIELVAELDEAYTKLYGHMICDLTDEEIGSMATQIVEGLDVTSLLLDSETVAVDMSQNIPLASTDTEHGNLQESTIIKTLQGKWLTSQKHKTNHMKKTTYDQQQAQTG